MHIGMLGTGRMGMAMAQRLLDCGHTLTVWNRTASKVAPLAERGATVAATPAEVVAHSEIIISMLTDAAAIDASFGGPQGALSATLNGKLFIEMSTVRPITEIELARRIAERGGAMIDCPVGGTVGPARDGKLLGMVGGAAQDVARARPVLEQLCRRIEVVGDVGAGARLKLAINLPLLVYWQALGEAIALTTPLGIDPARLIDILADTSGGPTILKFRGAAIASALSGVSPGEAHFNIDSIRKDLRTMREEAASLGYALPLTSATLDSFDAASQAGLGHGDGTELAAWWIRNQRCDKP